MIDSDVLAPANQSGNHHIDLPEETTRNAVTLARQLADAVQNLVRELDSQDQRRRELEQRLATAEQQAAVTNQARAALHQAATSSVSDEDLQNLQQVLQKLAQDPNHIMVLAAVAQQAETLSQVVNTYKGLRSSLGET